MVIQMNKFVTSYFKIFFWWGKLAFIVANCESRESKHIICLCCFIVVLCCSSSTLETLLGIVSARRGGINICFKGLIKLFDLAIVWYYEFCAMAKINLMTICENEISSHINTFTSNLTILRRQIVIKPVY